MEFVVGERVEVRGEGNWRKGTVTGQRPNGKWEVKIDGWEKPYTWPQIRPLDGQESGPAGRAGIGCMKDDAAPSSTKSAPSFVPASVDANPPGVDANPPGDDVSPPDVKASKSEPAPDENSKTASSKENTGDDSDDDLLAPGVKKPFAAGMSAGKSWGKASGNDQGNDWGKKKKGKGGQRTGPYTNRLNGKVPVKTPEPAKPEPVKFEWKQPSVSKSEEIEHTDDAETKKQHTDDTEAACPKDPSEMVQADMMADWLAGEIKGAETQFAKAAPQEPSPANASWAMGPSFAKASPATVHSSSMLPPPMGTSSTNDRSDPADGQWSSSWGQAWSSDQSNDWGHDQGNEWGNEQDNTEYWSWNSSTRRDYDMQWYGQSDIADDSISQMPNAQVSADMPSPPVMFPPSEPPPPALSGEDIPPAPIPNVPAILGNPGAPRQPPQLPEGNCAPQRGDLSVLLVAEKPAIARAFAEALAPNGYSNERERGRLPTYAFTGPWVGEGGPGPPGCGPGMTCNYRVTSTVGHIWNLDFPLSCRHWRGVDPDSLFDADPVHVESNEEKLVPQHLADEASRCHVVVLCLDCDREGESIGYECLSYILPNLAPHKHVKAPDTSGEQATYTFNGEMGVICGEDGIVQAVIDGKPADTNGIRALHKIVNVGPNPFSKQSLKNAENSGSDFCVTVQAEEPLPGRDFKDDPRVWRVHFSALANDDLRSAMKELRKPDPLQSRSVDARAEIDLKVGVALTRLITSNLRHHVQELAPQRENESRHGAMISYGPCQTPTLGFCVQRWDEIQQFRNDTAYTLDLSVRTGSGDSVALIWEPPQDLLATASGTGHFRGRGTREKDMLDNYVVRACASDPLECICTHKEKRERRVERPLALNTVELLKTCSRELGMNPQKTMEIAEKLYLAGFTTYPRTETTQYPPSFPIRDILEEHVEHPKWGYWCRNLLGEPSKSKNNKPDGLLTEARRGVNVGDHPPITPVKCATDAEFKTAAGGLGKDAVRVYELICNWLFASFSPDVKYLQHELIFELEGFHFILRGNEITDWGYLRISRGAGVASSSASALYESNLLKQPSRLELTQQVVPGMRVEVSGLQVRQLSSKPPVLLTEAELLNKMEINQIGTDASMPTHVSTIVTRGYVEVLKPDRRMRPTILGVALVHGLHAVDAELTRAAVRARIERDVSDVASGERSCAEVVATALAIFREKFYRVRASIQDLVQEVNKTKTYQYLWDGKAGPESQNDAEEGEPDVVVMPPAPPKASDAAGASKKQRTEQHKPEEKSTPRCNIVRHVREPQDTTEVPDVPESPATASIEELRAENKTLRQLLQVAKLKAESGKLRAENMEIKYIELEGKYIELAEKHDALEAKLSKLRPPDEWSKASRASKGASKGSSSASSKGAPSEVAKAPPSDKPKSESTKGVPPPSFQGIPPPEEKTRKRRNNNEISLAGKRPYAPGASYLPDVQGICWQFVKGNCPRGTKCKYSHASSVRVPEEALGASDATSDP